MSGRLAGKVVIITGAAQGQGLAHAHACAAHGASVLLADINTEAGEAAAAQLRTDGANAHFTRLDVRSSADWAAAVSQAQERFGLVNALVNNAGIPSGGDVLTTTDEEWANTVAINQTGMFLGIRGVAPAIQAAGGGSIVNVSSTLGFFASRAGFAYQATKGAVRMMTKSAALALAADKIRVNTVLPGLVDTPFLDGLRKVGGLQDSLNRTALGRAAQPDEISNGIVFLLSDESSYVTGSELVIDGGLTAGSSGSLQPAPATIGEQK